MKVWWRREAMDGVTARSIVGMPVPLRNSLTCCLEMRKEQMGQVLLEQPGTLSSPSIKQANAPEETLASEDAPDTDIHWPELLSGQGLVGMNN